MGKKSEREKVVRLIHKALGKQDDGDDEAEQIVSDLIRRKLGMKMFDPDLYDQGGSIVLENGQWDAIAEYDTYGFLTKLAVGGGYLTETSRREERETTLRVDMTKGYPIGGIRYTELVNGQEVRKAEVSLRPVVSGFGRAKDFVGPVVRYVAKIPDKGWKHIALVSN